MKSELIIKLLYWIVNFFFWAFILASGIMIWFNLYAWGIVERDLSEVMAVDLSEVMAVALRDQATNLNAIWIDDKEIPVHVSKVIVNIHLSDLSKEFLKLFFFLTLVANALVIYVLFCIKAILWNVRQKRIFTLENADKLLFAGYGLAMVWMLHDVVLPYVVKSHFNIETPWTIGISSTFLTNNLLITVMVFLVLAQIFKAGINLQNENELTI